MSRSIGEGPPGLEVPHKINGLYSEFVMNERDARPARTRLTKLGGYYSLPEADDNREAHVGRRGEAIFPGAPRGKTIVYEGELQGRSLGSLRALMAAFKLAVACRNQELQFQIQDSEVPWFFNARVLDLDIDDEQYNGPTMIWPWSRKFQLSLRLSDPRFYVDDGGSIHDGNADGAVITVNNLGQTDTEPSFSVSRGSTGDIHIQNITTSRQLVLNGVPAGATNFNFATREITNGETDVSEHLNEAESEWWDEDVVGLIPGENELTASGGTWDMSFYHASE